MHEMLVRVLGHYALGHLRDIQRVEAGFVDENWIVSTESGRFFLKRRHPRRRQSGRLICAQHSLMAWLRQASFPAPEIVPTIAGESYLVLDDDVYEVAVFIEGLPFDHGRVEHLDLAARTLGWYHTCVQGFGPQVLRERGELYCPSNCHTVLERLCEIWQIEHNVRFGQVFRQLKGRIDDLSTLFARHSALIHLVIHGDFYAGNLLFGGDQVVGLVDYDKANWQPRLAELAEALIYFASSRPGHLRHLVYPGFLDWDLFRQFLRNYARVSNLTDGEIRALPDYICCVWLLMSVLRLLEQSPNCPTIALEALHEVLALGTWASVNAGQMIEVTQVVMAGESWEVT